MVNDNIVHNRLSISPEFLQTAVLVLGSLGLHGTKVHGSINEVVHTPQISFICHTVEATWLVTWNGTTASSPLLGQLAQCSRTIRYKRVFVWNLAICYGCRKLKKKKTYFSRIRQILMHHALYIFLNHSLLTLLSIICD